MGTSAILVVRLVSNLLLCVVALLFLFTKEATTAMFTDDEGSDTCKPASTEGIDMEVAM